MGRKISRLQSQSKWGTAFFDSLSLDLKAEFPNQTGFSSTNIKYVVRWYKFYNQEDKIRQQVVVELSERKTSNLQGSLAEIKIIRLRTN